MEIPEKLVIFGRMYDVRDVSPSQLSEGVIGQTAYRDGVIYLDESTDLALKLNAMWNEAISVAQQDLHGFVDESQARWIGLFIHNFLIQNPEILECYLGGIEQSSLFDDDNNSDKATDKDNNG
jgi:hypothetical protein